MQQKVLLLFGHLVFFGAKSVHKMLSKRIKNGTEKVATKCSRGLAVRKCIADLRDVAEAQPSETKPPAISFIKYSWNKSN